MGVLKFGFGSDVPLEILKVDLYMYQFSNKKLTRLYTNC